MQSAAWFSFAAARNAEDLDEDHDPGWEHRPLPASRPYGTLSDDWLVWQDLWTIPEDEEPLWGHADAIAASGLGDGVAWCAAYCADFEGRVGGCLDAGLL